MARQHAVRSVVESFGKLSFDQQKDAFVQVQDLHEQSRSVKRAELEQQLVELGYRAPKKQGAAEHSMEQRRRRTVPLTRTERTDR